MILDSFLFIFGVFAAISAFMNLVAPRRTGYGLITLILGSLTGLCSYTLCTTSSISIWMAPKIVASVLLFEIHADSCWSHVPLGHCLVLYFLTPTSSQPNYSRCFAIVLGALALVLRFYLKKRFNIKSSSTAPATRR